MPPWKDDRVIGQRTFRDREINSQHSRHGQSSNDWRDEVRSVTALLCSHFPNEDFRGKMEMQDFSHKLTQFVDSFFEKNVLL